MKKIILIQLPPAVEQALTEQLKAFSDFEVVPFQKNPPDLSACNPDLVVAAVAASIRLPACPVLPLPFSKPLRLGAVLRQIGQMLAQPVLYIDDIAIGPYIFRPQEKFLSRTEGEDIALTDREVDILAYLVRHRKRPVNRDELLKNVWQYHEGVDTHTLETHIYRLRQKIEVSAEAPRVLLTIEGGYALHLSDEAEDR